MRIAVKCMLVVVCAVLFGCGSRSAEPNVASSAAGGPTPAFQAPILDGQVEALIAEAKKLGGDASLNLKLAGPEVTDDRLLKFPLPSQLETLDLSGSRVTDAGLIAALDRAPYVKRLVLLDVPVTDGVLEHLKAMPSLEEVELRHTKISTKGQLEMMQHLRSRGTANGAGA